MAGAPCSLAPLQVCCRARRPDPIPAPERRSLHGHGGYTRRDRDGKGGCRQDPVSYTHLRAHETSAHL
eukprot:3657630-Alexandrium_andersonii.AAC.1